MSLISRLKRIGRLAIALFRGFFTWKSTIGPSPRFDPEHTTLRTHLKEVARYDTILFFEPFTLAVKEFEKERAKPY